MDIQNRMSSQDEYKVLDRRSELTDYTEKLIALQQEWQVVSQSVYLWRENLHRQMELFRKIIVILRELAVCKDFEKLTVRKEVKKLTVRREFQKWDNLPIARPLLESLIRKNHYFALRDYMYTAERKSSTPGEFTVVCTKAPKDNTTKKTTSKGKSVLFYITSDSVDIM